MSFNRKVSYSIKKLSIGVVSAAAGVILLASPEIAGAEEVVEEQSLETVQVEEPIVEEAVYEVEEVLQEDVEVVEELVVEEVVADVVETNQEELEVKELDEVQEEAVLEEVEVVSDVEDVLEEKEPVQEEVVTSDVVEEAPEIDRQTDVVETDETFIDYDLLKTFVTEEPDKFNQVLAVAITVSTQVPDVETPEDVLLNLYDVMADETLEPALLEELAKFVIELERLANEETFEVQEVADFNIAPRSMDSGLSFYSADAGSILSDLGLNLADLTFKDVVGRVTNTTGSVVGLLEQMQAGERPAASIGKIVDTILPIGLNFEGIGGLIQMIAELKAQAVRDDVYFATEIVGALSALLPNEVKINGTPVSYPLNKLGMMAADIGMSVADGMVQWFHPGSFFNPQTIRLRGEVAGIAIEAIRLATTEWTTKPQIVHTKAGFEVTHALMSVVDPFSTVSRLNLRKQELLEMIAYGNESREITPIDIATTYVKERLDRAIWDVRLDRDKYLLTKVPFEVYHKLNLAITKAVGTQLYTETLVYQVDEAIFELEKAYNEAFDYLASIPLEEQIAPQDLKSELSQLIWEVRFDRDKNVLGKVDFEVYNELNQVLTQAVGLYTDLSAKTVDVEAMMVKLQNTLDEAKAIAEATQAELADKALKKELAQVISQARRVRDFELLGSVDYEFYRELNRTLTNGVHTQLSLTSTVGDVRSAIDKIQEALAAAQENAFPTGEWI